MITTITTRTILRHNTPDHIKFHHNILYQHNPYQSSKELLSQSFDLLKGAVKSLSINNNQHPSVLKKQGHITRYLICLEKKVEERRVVLTTLYCFIVQLWLVEQYFITHTTHIENVKYTFAIAKLQEHRAKTLYGVVQTLCVLG